MPKISPEWAKCITALLEKYQLTYRGARRKGTHLYSHMSVRDWAAEGVVPSYTDELPRFLELISSREEAIECLQSAGLPLPTEWVRTTTAPADRVRAVMAKYVVPGKGLTRGEVEAMRQEIEELGEE